MLPKKLGFTLIELLVVVLIIGILAAIAVPQYQAAVMKSKYSRFVIYGKTLAEAAERYYLVNGKYPDSWEDLDVDVPLNTTCTDTDKKCVRTGTGFNVDLEDGGHNFAFYVTPKRNIYYVIWFKNASATARRGNRECGAAPDDDAANKFCRSLGGVQNGTMGIMSAPAYIRYDLP